MGTLPNSAWSPAGRNLHISRNPPMIAQGTMARSSGNITARTIRQKLWQPCEVLAKMAKLQTSRTSSLTVADGLKSPNNR